MGIPLIRIGIVVQNRGGNGSPFRRRRGAKEDRLRTQTRKMMMGYLGFSGDDEGPGVIQDPRDAGGT